MSATVAVRRPTARPDDILVAAPVRALTGLESAKLGNWLLGRGAQLIPPYAPLTTVTATSELHYQFRVRPRYQALQRVWGFRLRAASPMEVTIEVPSGATAITAPVSTRRDTVHSFRIVETLGSQSDTEAEITCAIAPTSTTSLTIEGISCYEMPRGTLAVGGSDLGTELAVYVVGQPIKATLYDSIRAATSDPLVIGRRVSLSQWSVPATVAGATSTAHAKATVGTGSYETIYSGLPVLTRKDAPSATTGLVTCKMLAWVSGGSADLRLNSSVHGASTAVNITNTSPAWSGAITLSVDCEDLSTADGLQGAVFDRLTPEMRKNVSGTCRVAAVSIWEA
jgi:hypothetical protein